MTRILVATDAWHPQVNGVVRTYERLEEDLKSLGCTVDFITPADFRTVPCPTYSDIRLALPAPRSFARRAEAAGPDFIHIATEGPVGMMARAYCRKRGLPFTTSYHTRFPEYLAARLPIRKAWGYAWQRRFHNAGAGMMVATKSLAEELRARGFRNLMSWSRGVDTDLYRPRDVRLFGDGPVFLTVGRVAVEKNLEAFLTLDLPGRKVVVGDGPSLSSLKGRYPHVTFTGAKSGEELARCYASADVFVFPSLTDTFGIVLLEALASGLPVAAYPVTGPKDVVVEGEGVLDADLGAAARAALTLDRGKCRAHALTFSWAASARQFYDNVIAAQTQSNLRPGKK